MGKNKVPDYVTGRRGKRWIYSLQAARRNGAVIVADDGTVVTWKPRTGSRKSFSPWLGVNGERYDSVEVHPVF